MAPVTSDSELGRGCVGAHVEGDGARILRGHTLQPQRVGAATPPTWHGASGPPGLGEGGTRFLPVWFEEVLALTGVSPEVP